MRTFTFFITSLLLMSCGHPELKDASLKIDVKTLSTACECNDALITLMEETIIILKDIGAATSDEDKANLNAEYTKRLDKRSEIHEHCSAVYQAEGGRGNCDNNEKGEDLNQELSELQQKNGL